MPFCMGDTIHSISASILFHGTKMIQVRVLSLERSVHLQPIETSNSKRHPDHWWPLMTTDDHWWPLGRWQLWSSPLLHHWFKEVQCQMPSCYLFTGADHGTEANEIASNSQICHQLSGIAGWPWHLLCFLWITGYCRILQDIAGLLSFIATLLILLLPDPPGFPKMCQRRPSWNDLINVEGTCEQGSLGTLSPSKTSSWSLGSLCQATRGLKIGQL